MTADSVSRLPERTEDEELGIAWRVSLDASQEALRQHIRQVVRPHAQPSELSSVRYWSEATEEGFFLTYLFANHAQTISRAFPPTNKLAAIAVDIFRRSLRPSDRRFFDNVRLDGPLPENVPFSDLWRVIRDGFPDEITVTTARVAHDGE